MEGILLINKPKGWTSFDVVNHIRRIVANEQKVRPFSVKVGHCGTLDPLAEGLLVLLIGKTYTKMAMDLTKLDKEYLLTARLGQVTDSFDLETEPKFYSAEKPGLSEVKKAIDSFKGEISQKPPAFSALKVGGQRAYKMARKGQEVDLKPRPVTIYKLELISYDYPLVKLRSKVSSGTYIRSLVSDIGTKLNTGAYLEELVRTKIGDFCLEDSLKINNLTAEDLSEHLYYI